MIHSLSTQQNCFFFFFHFFTNLQFAKTRREMIDDTFLLLNLIDLLNRKQQLRCLKYFFCSLLSLLPTLSLSTVFKNQPKCHIWIFMIKEIKITKNYKFLARKFKYLKKLAVDGAFGSYSEASGGRLASLAYTPTARFARPPPARNSKINRKNISKKKTILLKKKSEAGKFLKKKNWKFFP